MSHDQPTVIVDSGASYREEPVVELIEEKKFSDEWWQGVAEYNKEKAQEK